MFRRLGQDMASVATGAATIGPYSRFAAARRLDYMSIEAFVTNLRKHSVGPGARWHKADFHVHAPASSDYEYRGADAVEQLSDERCGMREPLRSPSILKIRSFQPAKNSQPFEITLFQRSRLFRAPRSTSSWMHLSKKVNKDYFFHCIVAVDPDMSGDYGLRLQKAKEQFTYKGSDTPPGSIRASSIWVASSGRMGRFSFPPTCTNPRHRRLREASTICTDDEAFLGFVSHGDV